MELNEQEIELCQKAFSELDTDNVGSIKVADLKQALDRVNFFPNEFDYYKMISEIDENNTGKEKKKYKKKRAITKKNELNYTSKGLNLGWAEYTINSILLNNQNIMLIIKKKNNLHINIQYVSYIINISEHINFGNC